MLNLKLSTIDSKENIFYPLKCLDLPIDFDLQKIMHKINKQKANKKDNNQAINDIEPTFDFSVYKQDNFKNEFL